MQVPRPLKIKSKSADLDIDEFDKASFESIEEHNAIGADQRRTIKGKDKTQLSKLNTTIGQQSILKTSTDQSIVAKTKFVINSTTKPANGLKNNSQALMDRKMTNKNLRHTNDPVNNNATQKLPQMSSSYVIKPKVDLDNKKTIPFSDLTNPVQNAQWKKLQQVKKTIEEKRTMISQFETINR